MHYLLLLLDVYLCAMLLLLLALTGGLLLLLLLLARRRLVLLEVGPGRCCSPRHPTHSEPSFIKLNGIYATQFWWGGGMEI
jgi:hypothetical protein